MMYSNVFSKPIMSTDAICVDVNEINVDNQFTNGQEFEFYVHMLQWIHNETFKLRFGVVIRRSDDLVAFVTMKHERRGRYITPLRKFQRDDTGSGKRECSFKLRDYLLSNKKWRFNMIRGLHIHDIHDKSVDHPIACRFMQEEKGIISDMTLNMV